jgi:hypothetical protein
LKYKLYRPINFPQAQTDKIGFTMFSNVIHSLLGDPENDDLQGRGYVTFFDLDLPLDLNIRVGRLKSPAEPGKASQETQIVKDGWP